MSTAKKNSKNQRRFNDDQIKSLETMFQAESRPELRLKQHLANKLGLHPRQVAIWFQNKRARSKSKEVEREYNSLKADYDKLASKFETLMKENQALILQLQRLKTLAEERKGEKLAEENHFTVTPSENSTFLLEMNSHELCIPSCTDVDSKVDYLQETDAIDMPQIVEGPLTSAENGCSFESCSFLENTATNTLWWDF